MNGASALLHLVLASWKYDLSSELQTKLKAGPDKLKIEDPLHSARSAVETLCNEENMRLKIFLGRNAGEDFLFHHYVERGIEFLEKAFDYCEAKRYRSGYVIRNPLRPETLAGFDFDEIARSQDHVPRRFSEVKKNNGWLRLINRCKAITLFGRSFGDLISPHPPTCRSWSQMPTGEDYIAIRIQDLKRMNDRDPTILRGFEWRDLGNVFECACPNGLCNRAFILHKSSTKPKNPFGHGILDDKHDGAVIFGYGGEPIRWCPLHKH